VATQNLQLMGRKQPRGTNPTNRWLPPGAFLADRPQANWSYFRAERGARDDTGWSSRPTYSRFGAPTSLVPYPRRSGPRIRRVQYASAWSDQRMIDTVLDTEFNANTFKAREASKQIQVPNPRGGPGDRYSRFRLLLLVDAAAPLLRRGRDQPIASETTRVLSRSPHG